MEETKQRIAKYAVHGASAALLTKFLNNGSRINILGVDMNIYLAAGIAGALASSLADASHAWILPYVSADDRMKHIESALLTPAAGAASFTGVMFLGNQDILKEEGQLLKLMGTGAVSEVLAQYVYENFVLPLIADKYVDRV